MDNQNNNSVFQELINSVKYYFESKKGKSSLETYLQIIGEYTDRLIVAAQKDDLKYLGGECKVCRNKKQMNYLEFQVEMFFQDLKGNSVKKEAHRSLPVSKFTTESINSIGDNEIRFNIDKPEGEN